MEEDLLVRHMKRGKPICNRHQITGGTKGRLDLNMKYSEVEIKMSKFHADLASIDRPRAVPAPEDVMSDTDNYITLHAIYS